VLLIIKILLFCGTQSFFDIGELLIQRLFAAIAQTDLRVHDNLSKLTPQDLSNTAWAFAVLGMKHTPFFLAAQEQLLARTSQFVQGRKNPMTRFKGQEMANLLWAFAILNLPLRDLGKSVGPYMIQATIGSIEDLNARDIARVFIRQELANIAWSCAVFGEYPQDLMALIYGGLVGTGSERDPNHLCKCFGDSGMQSEAIMSLIYVQLAMEREGKDNGLTLPENFPENWNQKSRSHLHMDASSFELKLSTSKIQRDVSAALARVGFEHVEEHVITMDQLLDNQGIPLSPRPREVLSLDIANVEAGIGD
jgi:hypothetical protein